ncbi:tRNA (N6-isopentenyl adenosine(37)-C2)-methylthiotransferase MiaB [Candidatus Aerophobetes bacterium]|nr:tRNA (N6-isopentenyl adenosine(37)-C2)-methylthiotransferase MiaB [Candidatus Aerophobetes bacterium]
MPEKSKVSENSSRKVYIRTFGCQMNEYDSEVMAALLQESGFELTQDINRADFIVINTCYVREKVKHKVFSFLGELKKIKMQKPHVLLGVGGCLAQKEPHQLIEKAPFVDIIWGTLNLDELPELVKGAREKGFPIVKVKEKGFLPDDFSTIRKKRFSIYVPVIRGCNNFCSYCNVPYVRGREKSRSMDSILKEIEKAVAGGCKEVILLGQNVNSYGKDLPEKIDFATLLSEVNKLPGLCRIRFTTSHPKDLSGGLIVAMAKLKKVCEHLHLPLQAGSNRILKLMRRGYRRETYLELVDKLREYVPDVSLTTDLIVGFPGETEADFQDTLNMVKRVRFDGAFTFIYSSLFGTRAAELENQIPTNVKKERLRQLIQLQQKITQEKNKSYLEKELEVLVEGTSPKNPDELEGRTRHNKMVIFPGDTSLVGELVRVKIMQAGCWALRGEPKS